MQKAEVIKTCDDSDALKLVRGHAAEDLAGFYKHVSYEAFNSIAKVFKLSLILAKQPQVQISGPTRRASNKGPPALFVTVGGVLKRLVQTHSTSASEAKAGIRIAKDRWGD